MVYAEWQLLRGLVRNLRFVLEPSLSDNVNQHLVAVRLHLLIK
jgi:hypothetical protein